MPTNLTVAELKTLLTNSNAGWTVDERLKDTDILPSHPTGADLSKVPNIESIPRLDIKPFVSVDSSNPSLRQVRLNNGHLKAETLAPELAKTLITAPTASAFGAATAAAAGAAPAPSYGTAPSVDWRNRFGTNWLTQVKDQGGCESCWVFSAVGVVEAMTRIEHTIWSLRSEGDVHDGLGAQCATTGDPANALNWIKSNGVADPGCWPYEQSNLPYKPTADRSGRTVRLDSYVTLNNIADQKAWLDNVGPLSACFTCYNDFFAYGPNSGVYVCNPASGVAGGHCIVIVGYDDTKQAWLIRNSWSANWGMGGYCWFHYNQCGMDTNVKYGVPGASVNPDPWTKRRDHNGNFYESGDGTLHRNFETWSIAPGNSIRHYWRDGVTLKWSLSETQANDCASSPTVTGTTYNRNFEMVYETTTHRLHHRYFDQASNKWFDGPVFGPTNVAGVPGFIQSDFGSLTQPEKTAGPAGNFEVVVRVSDGSLEHWSRNDGTAGFPWTMSAKFGSGIAFSGPALMQRFDRGLDVVCVNNDGTMQRYFRPAGSTTWSAQEKFGSGIACVPVMIRSQYGMNNEATPGNYELCIAVNGAIEHWWTPGEAAAHWQKSATFGANVQQVLGVIESSFGFDLEVVALLKDGRLQHYWRGGSTWNAGPIYGTTK